MRLRRNLRQGTNVMLYMGPLLAGLAGQGWAVVPAFIAIFLAWSVARRPKWAPRTRADWATAPVLALVLAETVSQSALVLLALGIGRGLGGVMGVAPDLGPVLPLALSLTAIPLLKMLPARRAAVRRIRVALPREAEAPQAADESLALLLDLPGDASDSEMVARLDDLLASGAGRERLAELTEALAGTPGWQHRALRRAVIRQATVAGQPAPEPAPGLLRAAFAAAGQDDFLLAELALRALRVARTAPQLAAQFPAPAVIEDIGRRSGSAAVRQDMALLASVLRRAGRVGSPQPVAVTATA